ncbi:MAG TPA: hypothetical protein VHW00_06890 [Thermoanaerobaculia bacterium]|nr:hypothetical protein [Thermoanaerobaculia bacterium]
MKSSKLFLALFFTMVLLHAAAARAASIDMDDPRRALGREGDVRVDAQLVRDTVSPGSPIGVTWQIQNFSTRSVAVATRVADATYDEDSRTVTLTIGSEVPPDGTMPVMVLIAPGEKKTFSTAATPNLSAAASRRTFAASPRFVQVKLAVLREVTPFLPLIQAQSRARLSDEQFEQWFECNDTIFLNALPVQFEPARQAGGAGADARGSF